MNSNSFDDIVWPALRFADNCVVFRYDSSQNFILASAKKLRRWRKLKEDFIVDSNGSCYRISNPRFAVPPSLLAKIVGIHLPVLWDVLKEDSLSVDAVRELIQENFEEHISVWQATDLDELERRLREAQSIADVMDVFN